MGSVNQCRAMFESREVKLFRKAEAEGWYFRFLVASGGSISDFAKKRQVLSLVWGLHVVGVFENQDAHQST
jgi:hypothetical protein